MSASSAKPHSARLFIYISWAVILLISDLPNVLFATFTGDAPAWLFWAKVSILALLLAACLLSKPLRPIWQFALVFLVFFLALAARDWLLNTAFWQGLFSAEKGFTIAYLGVHIPDTAVALVVLAVLWLIKRRRVDFFLAKGQLDAPIKPVPWLAIKTGESWRAFGWIFTASAGVIILLTVLLGSPLSGETFARALPLLPAALLISGLNAFAEESYYRASLFSTLRSLTGDEQVLLMNVVFFGLAHVLAGSPPGLLGFALTGFLAFLLGKGMLETRGMVWPWLMHFVPDVFIFFSYALYWMA